MELSFLARVVVTIVITNCLYYGDRGGFLLEMVILFWCSKGFAVKVVVSLCFYW